MNLEDITGTIINGDCIEVMKTLPESSVDLVVTSCPYGVGIDYDIVFPRTTVKSLMVENEKLCYFGDFGAYVKGEW